MAVGANSDVSVIVEVNTAKEKWCQAIAERDWEAVDSFLYENYTFTHSSGKIDDKADFFAGIQARDRVLEWTNQEIRPFDNFAVLTGNCTITLAGIPEPHRYRSIQVWINRDDKWQLVAHQNTKIDAKFL